MPIDPLERQASLLLYLLGASGPRTREQIVAHVPGYPDNADSQKRQFERDKRSLQEQGVPLRIEEHGDEWFYEIRKSEYYLDLDLTDDERLALELALSAVRFGGAPADDVLAKVGADLDPARVPVTTSLPADGALPVLFDARRRRARVTFDYLGSRRTVDLFGVWFENGFWYAAGHDRTRDGFRVFRVDRIEGDVDVVDPGTVDVPADFNPADVIPDAYELPGDEPVVAVVRVDPVHGPLVADRLGTKAVVETDADGSVLVRFLVTNRAAFRSWLFGLLDHAIVVGPPELRNDVVAWLTEMAAAQ
jgi:proteasome accessory factor B